MSALAKTAGLVVFAALDVLNSKTGITSREIPWGSGDF